MKILPATCLILVGAAIAEDAFEHSTRATRRSPATAAKGVAGVERTKQLSVNGTPSRVWRAAGEQPDSIRCTNTTTAPTYFVEADDTTATQGDGPYCTDSTACPGGTVYTAPVHEVYGVTSSGTATLQCGFVDNGASFSGGGGAGGLGLGAADARYLKLDATNGPVTGALTLSGALSVNGNTTLGDATGDSVTSNAASWSFPQSTTFTLGNQLTLSGDTFNFASSNSTQAINFGWVAQPTIGAAALVENGSSGGPYGGGGEAVVLVNRRTFGSDGDCEMDLGTHATIQTCLQKNGTWQVEALGIGGTPSSGTWSAPKWNFASGADGGDMLPGTDNDVSIGSETKRVKLVRAVTVTTGDLVMNGHDVGGARWRLVEADDRIVVVNEDTGARFHLVMEAE